MGHCSQIALGIAMQKQDRLVYCLDGDGSLIMHMGSLAINAAMKCKNFKHGCNVNGKEIEFRLINGATFIEHST